MIFVRWKDGEPRRGRVFEPLAADHPAVGIPCPPCDEPIGTTRPVQLVAVGPVFEGDRQAHLAGRWYSAGAALLHEDCADRLTDSALELLISELAIVPMGGAK
jgi:hypothetical protein